LLAGIIEEARLFAADPAFETLPESVRPDSFAAASGPPLGSDDAGCLSIPEKSLFLSGKKVHHF
jgi:hypothetical protein